MANEAPKVARLATETVSTAQPMPEATTATAARMMPGFAGLTGTAGTAGMQTAMEQAGKAAQDFAEFSRGNAEIMAQVAQTWMTGTQDISRQAFSFAQALTEHALEGARALSGVKSLKEAADIQTTYARGAMDKVMSETAKIQEASFRLAEQVSGPVSQRVSIAMERMGKPLAA
ncbi:phasin family protein [Pararoseomonas indoligenes]|uniref:Phasin family protein n=1 Tax=Roseomonas indoligenes TaxID=2820811 RepID=A0A940S6C1_9PROT|nr:phasin family protein [Pararoseomonas indoligenes]MBP0491892.1 phasin family protein [Pararoseomonas indoligenes]